MTNATGEKGNLLEAIFGEGATAEAEAAETADRERIALWSSRTVTEAGVLKAWKMTACPNGNLATEMSDLASDAGWGRLDPPARITVALDEHPFGRLKIYRRWLIDRTPDGDIGAWIYVPNQPEPGIPAEVHILND